MRFEGHIVSEMRTKVQCVFSKLIINFVTIFYDYLITLPNSFVNGCLSEMRVEKLFIRLLHWGYKNNEILLSRFDVTVFN